LFFNEISKPFCDAKQVFKRRDGVAAGIRLAFRDMKRSFGTWWNDRFRSPRVTALPRM
jgi:hypothetical protein